MAAGHGPLLQEEGGLPMKSISYSSSLVICICALVTAIVMSANKFVFIAANSIAHGLSPTRFIKFNCNILLHRGVAVGFFVFGGLKFGK